MWQWVEKGCELCFPCNGSAMPIMVASSWKKSEKRCAASSPLVSAVVKKSVNHALIPDGAGSSGHCTCSELIALREVVRNGCRCGCKIFRGRDILMARSARKPLTCRVLMITHILDLASVLSLLRV